MSTTNYPPQYLILNDQPTKQLNVVVQIDGVPDLLSLVPIYEKIRYGDPRLTYGLPGIVYGGLIAKENVKPILMINSGLQIQQQIEPEQGRGSVATMNLSFIDKDEYMTQFISNGVIVEEPLGNTLVQVAIGFVNSSYPEDYYRVFRGYITGVTSQPGVVILELSDANIKRRQTIFLGGTSSLSSGIDDTQTAIPVFNTTGFIQPILGPDGTYDPSVTTYIKIDDEFMTYAPTGINTGLINVLSRGGSHSRGTTPNPHDPGATVTNNVQFQGNVIELALKIMLSGWNGPWLSDVAVSSLGTSLDPLNPEPAAILLPAGIDAVDDYGLTPGDYIYVTGSTAANDGTYIIREIDDALGDPNRMVIVDNPFNLENPASTVSVAFRSQYDTFPIFCGTKNTPIEVDVATHQLDLKNFFSSNIYTEQVFIPDTQNGQSGKDLIEGTLWLPIGVYSITRYGRISLAVTKPPVAQQNIVYLDQTNVLEPDKIRVQRALNRRRFYNVIAYSWDLSDAGDYASTNNLIDSTSLTKINYVSTLPINADGVKTTLGGAVLVQTRGTFILNRYKNAAYEITLKVNWQAGSIIEVGDVIALRDNGTLQISNLETGKRDLGTQLFEVIQRKLDIKTGVSELTLLSNLGYKIGERYATISPSSIVTTGSTLSSIEIQDSYGPLFPGAEHKKWDQFIGLPILVHDYFYTQSATAILLGFDPLDKYKMLVSPNLAFAPSAGQIVDIVSYGTGSDPNYIAHYKTFFSFVSPSIDVVSGISDTQFTVSPGDIGTFNTGIAVVIHNQDYSLFSPECLVSNIDTGTNTITVGTSIGFTPASGQLVEGIGFKDGGGFYRYL